MQNFCAFILMSINGSLSCLLLCNLFIHAFILMKILFYVIDRKHHGVSSEDDDVSTTCGATAAGSKHIADDFVTSLNSQPGYASFDRNDTGSHQEITSGKKTTTSTSGLCAVDPEMARFWLQRHATNMASNMAALSSHRFARAFLPLQLTAAAAFQGQGHCQGQSKGQGHCPSGDDLCYYDEDQGLDFSKARGHDYVKGHDLDADQGLDKGQGHCGGQFEGQGIEELRKLSETVSPTSADKNSVISAVDMI